MTIPVLQLITYSFTLWFGLYLIARDLQKSGLRYAGLGLVSYAIAIALLTFTSADNTPQIGLMLALMLPSVFWMSATLYLTPDVPVERSNVHLIFAMILVILLTLSATVILPDFTVLIALVLPIIFFTGVVYRLYQIRQANLPRPPLAILATATIFFALATGIILFPLGWLATEIIILAIGLDLICLGYSVAVLDAYDEGTTILAETARSLLASVLAVVIFGGQVMLVMTITETVTRPMLMLLFGVVTTVLFLITFANVLQSLLDSVIFVSAPHIKTQRDDFRAIATAITRTPSDNPLLSLDEDEFARLTRRALSYYGDLNKLASSPLTQLPMIDAHIDDDNLLARAQALKTLLRQQIDLLKPDDNLDFATTDEWRYFNVLYFPYVVGLKPYSRRFYRDDLTGAETEALNWLRTYVPERTLYNWQKTGADLIAQNLRDQMTSATGD